MQLAVLIILLHSVVPHHHHSEAVSATSCTLVNSESDENLLDLLGEIFHTDLGDDHLENWVKSSQHILSIADLDLHNDWCIPPNNGAALSDLEKLKNQSSTLVPLCRSYTRIYPDRGPPSYILA